MVAALQQRPAPVEHRAPAAHVSTEAGPRAALVVAVLGMFVVTLDALVVNVALP
ncbi:MAG: hypothetical protein JOY61_12125, partial [Chloroflexi bacterium]|nr:hypothetical protein [Chloroflexota bacterium]